MARVRLADWQWGVLGMLIILAAWQLYGSFTNPFFLPPPLRVGNELATYITTGLLAREIQHTILLLVVGLVTGALVGIPAGLLLGVNPTASAVLAPYLQAAYATPRIALIPVVIIWFGVGLEGSIVLVFLQCVFEILIATEAGAREVSGQFVEVARSFRLSRVRTFIDVIAPGSIPYIVSGLRLGLSNAFIGAIGAELFMESRGIGGIVRQAGQAFRTDRVLAAVIVMAVLAVSLISLMRYWERRTQAWRVETFE